MAAAQRSAAQQRLVLLLGPAAEAVSATTRRHGSLPGAASARTVRTDSRLRPGSGRRRRCRRPTPRAPSAPITSPTSCASSNARREVQPPVRLRQPELNELATDPLSLAGYDAFILQSRKESRDLPATKLNQLSLTTMSHQLDQMISDAATKNLSFAQALESLADLELELPQRPRHRAPLPPVPPAGPALHRQLPLQTPQEPHASRRTASCACSIWSSSRRAPASSSSAIQVSGKTFLAKIIGWRACQANQRVLFTTAMDMLNHLHASQVDHSLVRKLRVYTEPALVDLSTS